MNDVITPGPLQRTAAPRLTAVMLMPRSFSLLTASLSSLHRQSIKDWIELVVVHTPAFRSTIDRSACEGFHSVKFVEVHHMPTVAAGFVAGAAVASAPVVAQVEDHVFLDPRWAEWVCEAHRDSCGAVVPKMTNANPATASSWANFFVCFCEPFTMCTGGPVQSGPGHNTSYKRSVLRSYCDELETLYQSERNFAYRLTQDGHRILAEPRAQLAHVNISIPRKVMSHAFFGGVLFGKYRSAGMGVAERLVRSLLAPLVPPVRFWRMARTLGLQPLVSPDIPRASYFLAPFVLMAHATGEVAGYWRLVRLVEARYEVYELHRTECIRPDERALLIRDDVRDRTDEHRALAAAR